MHIIKMDRMLKALNEKHYAAISDRDLEVTVDILPVIAQMTHFKIRPRTLLCSPSILYPEI